MSDPTVFVVQDSGHNLAPLMQFGQIEIVTPGNYPYFRDNTKSFVQQMKEKLNNFDPVNDYLVPTGDPICIGIAFSILNVHDQYSVLKWDKQSRRYIQVEIPNV